MARRNNEEIEYENEFLHKIKPFRVIGLLLLLIGVITGLVGLTNVGATERAVIFHANGDLEILEPGKFQWVTPIVNDITMYNVREVVYTESAIGITKNKQETTTEVTVRYQPDPTKIEVIHQDLGRGYKSKVIVPAVQGCVKDIVSDYHTDSLTGSDRAIVMDGIGVCISKAAKEANLLVVKVTVTDFDFSPAFNAAIEAKAVAEQKAEEEKNRLEQVKYLANQTVVQAEAQARATRLLNEAMNSGDTSSNAYLFLQWLEKWNGILPSTLVGEQTSGLIISPPSSG